MRTLVLRAAGFGVTICAQNNIVAFGNRVLLKTMRSASVADGCAITRDHFDVDESGTCLICATDLETAAPSKRHGPAHVNHAADRACTAKHFSTPLE